MAQIHIPSLLRALTNGLETIELPGSSLREVLENLDRQFPGTRDRLIGDDRLRPGIAVSIDGVFSRELGAQINSNSDIHILPAISGG